MKLYGIDLSNFVTKTRIVLYEKGVAFEKAAPPGGMGSAEYKQLNPSGKIPALQLDSGQVIGESEVINEYLEEKYPQNPMLPKDPEGRAVVRGCSRFHDLYLEPPLRAVLPKLFGQKLDDQFIADKMTEVNARLDQLEGSIGSPWATGANFSMADAALAPTIFFMINMLPMFGSKGPLEGRPKLAAWWANIQARPSSKKAIDEQQAALTAFMKK